MKALSDIMTSPVMTIPDTASVQDAVTLFSSHPIGCLPVVDAAGGLVGFLSNGDVVAFVTKLIKQRQTDQAAIAAELASVPVMQCATRRVAYATPGDNLAEVAATLDKKHIKHMPVVDGETRQVVGLISRHALVLAFFENCLCDTPTCPDAS